MLKNFHTIFTTAIQLTPDAKAMAPASNTQTVAWSPHKDNYKPG